MAHIQTTQKKTSTMSLTISSSSATSSSSSRELSSNSSNSSSSSSAFLTQRHSSLVQPLSISPQMTQSPQYNQQYSGNGVAPTFVKYLHDVSALKGQLVVLECRLRGTPPLQVMWYREDEQILDSDNFRLLRKKASSVSVPEELCTLVITEAFPEESGLFKCMALNPFGSVSCSAVLEVYNDIEEQLETEALHRQEVLCLGQETESAFLPPPPDWPDSPLQDGSIPNTADFPEPLPPDHSAEEPFSHSEDEERALSSESQMLPEVAPAETCTLPPPSPLPPAPSSTDVKENEEKAPAPKLFTPSRLSFTSLTESGADSMNLSDLPTFTPSAFPHSGFNYARPRHFIQSQPTFQAPSYDSVQQQEAQQNQAQISQDTMVTGQSRMVSRQSQSVSCNQTLSQSVSQTQSQFQSLHLTQAKSQTCVQVQSQANGTGKSSPSSSGLSSPTSGPASTAPLPSSSIAALRPIPSISVSPSAPPPSFSAPLPRTPMRSTITLTPSLPSVPSATGLGSASLPANPDARSAPVAYLCSILPSKLSTSPLQAPSSPLLTARQPFQPPGSASLSPISTYSPTTSAALSQPSQAFPALPTHNQNRVPPAVVSLPASYKVTPATLPKPILKKTVAPRPSSSRSTDEDIQGSKDALIQDLEKKLRSKEARRRSGQKLSYEERMARRLLGPASYMVDQDNLDAQPDQADFPEGRHTGGLWGKHHSGTDERVYEGSAIQEKCYAPRFLQVPPDLTMEEGRFCRIDFKVGGLPTPDVSWYLDGKAIRPDDYHKMLVCEKAMHSFIIEIVTVHHAGVYECVAKNRAGESRFNMRLDVIAQELLRPPTFVQKMMNSHALEGDTVRFECKVDASPAPQLFWKKDKDMLRLDPNRMSLYQDGSGRQCLLLDRVTKSDAGWYTLSAINEAGMSTCNSRLDVGTRTTAPMKTAPPGSKALKLLSCLSHQPTVSGDSPAQHTAPLYESEEL